MPCGEYREAPVLPRDAREGNGCAVHGAMSTPILFRLVLGGLLRVPGNRAVKSSRMADRLDIVTIGIQHECCIIMWMIVREKPRRSVFNALGGHGRGEECINIRPRSCVEREVDARCHQRTFG